MAEGDFHLKRDIVERTSNTETRPEEQSEKAESRWRIYRM